MVNLIVAIGKDNLIGKGNMLPWHYKEDMKYFKEMTMGKKVIMGELTFKSIISYINKPLPGRTSIIATLTDYTYPGIEITNDIISYLKDFPKDEEVFIIGGKIIYDLTLDLADKLYITHVNKEYDGNVYFKNIDYSKYNKVSEKISGDLNFSVYERIE
ncbi:MAG: Dihydrofolate reductase type 3 [Candidatus Izimaplasma bacterium HR2]|nr:MAG: Dihydrofolate reductase type 3 [Candidatus Izimaplasma bacterium HR2]